jgi:hypothetical protein
MNRSEPKPLTPLDLPLVRRVIPQRLALDTAAALMRGMPGLEDVLLSSVPLADLGSPTLVIRNEDGGGGVGQFRLRSDKTVAHLTFLAPEPQESESHIWALLLDALVFEAGRRGAHLISAEVPEGHWVGDLFRTAGFAVYSRQVILRRKPGMPLVGADPDLLRPEHARDAIGLSALQVNTVPRLLLQAEPVPAADCTGLVYERDGQIAGYLAVAEGKTGIVIKPYFHPEVYDQAAAILVAALAHLPRSALLPVYVYARAYQDWLRGVLERVEFESWMQQALMVKHTLVRVERLEFATMPGLEGYSLHPPVIDRPVPLRKFVSEHRPGLRQSRRLPEPRNGDDPI